MRFLLVNRRLTKVTRTEIVYSSWSGCISISFVFFNPIDKQYESMRCYLNLISKCVLFFPHFTQCPRNYVFFVSREVFWGTLTQGFRPALTKCMYH
eukprot:UN24502